MMISRKYASRVFVSENRTRAHLLSSYIGSSIIRSEKRTPGFFVPRWYTRSYSLSTFSESPMTRSRWYDPGFFVCKCCTLIDLLLRSMGWPIMRFIFMHLDNALERIRCLDSKTVGGHFLEIVIENSIHLDNLYKLLWCLYISTSGLLSQSIVIGDYEYVDNENDWIQGRNMKWKLERIFWISGSAIRCT